MNPLQLRDFNGVEMKNTPAPSQEKKSIYIAIEYIYIYVYMCGLGSTGNWHYQMNKE